MAMVLNIIFNKALLRLARVSTQESKLNILF
jgi:hypothetical protein